MKPLLLLLLIISAHSYAQISIVPDCCGQAIQLTKDLASANDKLSDARTILEQTRQTTTRLLQAKDDRIRTLEAEGTARLTALTTRAVNAETLGEHLTAQLLAVTAERDKLRGKTVAGKLLRKARDGLALAGGLAVTVGLIRLL